METRWESPPSFRQRASALSHVSFFEENAYILLPGRHGEGAASQLLLRYWASPDVCSSEHNDVAEKRRMEQLLGRGR